MRDSGTRFSVGSVDRDEHVADDRPARRPVTVIFNENPVIVKTFRGQVSLLEIDPGGDEDFHLRIVMGQ
jgi:hypothetical protein